MNENSAFSEDIPFVIQGHETQIEWAIPKEIANSSTSMKPTQAKKSFHTSMSSGESDESNIFSSRESPEYEDFRDAKCSPSEHCNANKKPVYTNFISQSEENGTALCPNYKKHSKITGEVQGISDLQYSPSNKKIYNILQNHFQSTYAQRNISYISTSPEFCNRKRLLKNIPNTEYTESTYLNHTLTDVNGYNKFIQRTSKHEDFSDEHENFSISHELPAVHTSSGNMECTQFQRNCSPDSDYYSRHSEENSQNHRVVNTSSENLISPYSLSPTGMTSRSSDSSAQIFWPDHEIFPSNEIKDFCIRNKPDITSYKSPASNKMIRNEENAHINFPDIIKLPFHDGKSIPYGRSTLGTLQSILGQERIQSRHG